MILNMTSQSAVFTQHNRAVGVVEEDMGRTVVVVQVNDVAYTLVVVASTGGIDQARCINGTCVVYNLRGLELSPTFVKRCPDNDTGIIQMFLDDFFPLALIG